ncbi:hypothetical protein RHMOL_Rhmol07G0304000 [Rhododendron molle]|uniref:Uncharacterized protein n=1 Tax=Rhododendron molle TaxID=49168 RepID=A0ACC0N6L5_RHOML|nr:hypothetical protein RHMOL_Rhmol07G0304000 [Rhododendron molle]
MQAMVMLCISAFHPIPGDMTGRYFVAAVLLMAVGKAGGVPILEGFLVGQLKAHKPRKDEGIVNARKNVWWNTASLLCGLSTPWIFGHVNAGWLVTFICSTSVMSIGYLLFLCCIPLHHRSVDEADTTSEISRAGPKENTNNGPTLAVSTGRSRSANEAATTTEISRASPDESTNNGPTRAVSTGRRQKEQWKHLSIMIPIWTSFLVFGLVLSTGDTFFTEQGNNMQATVSIYRLNMIRIIIKAISSSSFSTLLLKHVSKQRKTKSIIVGIWIAMLVSVFCCNIAWHVEDRRLHVIAKYGLCVNGDDHAVIPMSILFLAPQFCLLGLMEGIGRKGLDLFFEAQVSDVPMDKYGSALNEAVIGFGSFLNAVLVYGLKSSWFGNTLNCSSRLDNYYQMLMVLSYLNLCYYWLVSTLYWNKKETKDDIVGSQETVIILVV